MKILFNVTHMVLGFLYQNILMDDVHLLTARHFRYELRRGGKIFSNKFGAREVCIVPQKIYRGMQWFILLIWHEIFDRIWNSIAHAYCMKLFFLRTKLQILAKHTKSVRKKFAKHFKKVYNLLDFLVVIMFLFGFAIKAELGESSEQYAKRKLHNLNSFS